MVRLMKVSQRPKRASFGGLGRTPKSEPSLRTRNGGGRDLRSPSWKSVTSCWVIAGVFVSGFDDFDSWAKAPAQSRLTRASERTGGLIACR